MTRPDLHDAAFGLVAIAIAATIMGPSGPVWMRWFGMVLAIPAIALFIATSPRSQR
jgi:hypothetical protein